MDIDKNTLSKLKTAFKIVNLFLYLVLIYVGWRVGTQEKKYNECFIQLAQCRNVYGAVANGSVSFNFTLPSSNCRVGNNNDSNDSGVVFNASGSG